MSYEKGDRVREEILVQAQILFQQYGLKKTTMDEIAAACGKAKSTLYHHFKSKEEVFESVVELEMLYLRKHVKDKVEEHKNMLDKINTYATEFHKEIINRINLYSAVVQENLPKIMNSQIMDKMMDYERSYLVRILEDGYDAGEYTRINREDIPYIAEIFLAAFFGAVRYFIAKDGTLSLERLQKTADLFIPQIFGK
ncbi:MAG: TetR/AcrR family transcriptional regulator [Prolixibacteraceae bacterium]|nr:TetR/AcrR family transcriptional regulator [Prolixibacteraceae bacterium]